MTTRPPDSRLGTDLGPYRIERVLGRGGMGVVYLATQRELGRKVALKLLPDELAHDADFRARFERESRLAAAIDHPNVIPLYEAGEVDGTLFLVMRYVDGVDLATRLKAGRPSASTAIEIVAQVAGALDAAHARGLVHRDVKPGNVLLDRAAGEERPHAYLVDFGLTKQAGSETGLTRAGSFLGTPAYMAPEQVDGTEVDGRADQYSLACLAFEALTGRVPFVREKEVAVALAHLKDPVPSAVALVPELPVAIDAVFAQAMAKDREARYATCGAFADDLRAALGGGAVSARPIGAASTPRRRTPLAIAAAIGLGLLAVAGLAWASGGLGGSGSGEPTPSASALTALASPSDAPAPTSSPTPDPSIFPNPAEQSLLEMLPPDLRATCERGRGQADAIEAGFTGQVIETYRGAARTPVYAPLYAQTPSSSLACSPTDAATPVNFQWFSESTPEGETVADALIGKLAGKLNLSDGDCGSLPPAVGRWESTSASGRIACAPDASGTVWLYWTFADGRALGFAGAEQPGYPALHDWFKRLVSFLP